MCTERRVGEAEGGKFNQRLRHPGPCTQHPLQGGKIIPCHTGWTHLLDLERSQLEDVNLVLVDDLCGQFPVETVPCVNPSGSHDGRRQKIADLRVDVPRLEAEKDLALEQGHLPRIHSVVMGDALEFVCSARHGNDGDGVVAGKVDVLDSIERDTQGNPDKGQ